MNPPNVPPGDISPTESAAPSPANSPSNPLQPIMNPGPFKGWGRLGWKAYLILRQKGVAIKEAEARGQESQSQIARSLGISASIYRRVSQLIANNSALVATAQVTGDWTALEDKLFSRYGQYWHLPGYKQVLAIKGDREPRQPRKRLSNLDRPATALPALTPSLPTEQKSEKTWSEIGRAVEKCLSPVGLARLLQDDCSSDPVAKAQRMQRVLAAAGEEFMSEEAVQHWLHCKLRSLGGHTPHEVMQTDIGADIVLTLLGCRLHHEETLPKA